MLGIRHHRLERYHQAPAHQVSEHRAQSRGKYIAYLVRLMAYLRRRKLIISINSQAKAIPAAGGALNSENTNTGTTRLPTSVPSTVHVIPPLLRGQRSADASVTTASGARPIAAATIPMRRIIHIAGPPFVSAAPKLPRLGRTCMSLPHLFCAVHDLAL